MKCSFKDIILIIIYLAQNEQAKEAIRSCTEVLEQDAGNINALKDRAEAYILEEQYEEGTIYWCFVL